MKRVGVFVVEGHDIELYEDAEAAALEVESYDASGLAYFGTDGTLYKANIEGPEWGPVRLHRTQENRLEDLVRLLRTEADLRGVPLPPGTPDDPEAIWGALQTAQVERRRPRRPWTRSAKQRPPTE
jgi:hypothetical protein